MGLLVITPKGILFISQTDLAKHLQISLNASNLEKLPFFTSKVHPRVCWDILIILQLQRTAIDNARIDTIDTINTINTIDTINRIICINQYGDNKYDRSNRLEL